MESSRWPLAAAFAGGALVTVAATSFHAYLDSDERDSPKELNISAPYNFQHLAAGAEGLRVLTLNEKPPPILEEASRTKQSFAVPRLDVVPEAEYGTGGLESTIGNTPLIKLSGLSEATGCTILGKVEYLNGAGNSPKDRVALSIINAAEKAGHLRPNEGDVIYEGTVGSTGISLATIARARGYTAHIFMPDDQAHEKSNLLLKLGANVERVTPAPITSPQNFINLARRAAQEHTDDTDRRGRGFFADQFENEANCRAHFDTTGAEIFKQTGGKLNAFVAGAGTGGTISGVGRYLKQSKRMKDLKVVLADPQGSGLYNRVKYGVMFSETEREGTRRRQQVDSMVEGIGCNRVVANFEAGKDFIDDAIRVTDEQALAMARFLVEKDGVFIGSSGAVNCVAAARLALQLGPGHTVVTILCDSGSRHLSKFWAKAGNVGGESSTKLEDVLAR